jgi:predicted kinase
MKKKFYMLIGIPGSGKSTWIINQEIDWNNTVIISSDDRVEEYAKRLGKTYSDVWAKYVQIATKIMFLDLDFHIEDNKDIIWDQTNVSVKSRADKLSIISDDYEKIAVFFTTPSDEELSIRLANRPGKFIQPEVIDRMKSQLQLPTLEEGFNEIIIVENK